MKKTFPKVIAHRGDTQHHLENTLPAFEAAIRSKADGIELDLQITRDDKIVIFHDKDLQRLANRAETIEHTDYATLKKIKLFKGAHIPLLDDLFDLADGKKILLNLELKTPHKMSGKLEEALAKRLKSYRHKAQLILSSFNPLSLIRLKVLAPTIKRGYLFEDKFFLHRFIIPLTDCFSIHAPFSCFSPSAVSKAHQQDQGFFVWTVNNENDMQSCINAGVDGIITDQPGRLQNILKRQNT